MKDRSVQYPNRYRLVPVAGETNVVELYPEPGEVTEEGTAICKGTMLADETASMIGLTQSEPTVNDAFMVIGVCDTNKAFVIVSFKDEFGDVMQNVRISGTANGYTDADGNFAFEPTPGLFSLSAIYPIGYSGPGTISGTALAGKRTVINVSDCRIIRAGTYEMRTSGTIYLAPFIQHADLFAVGGGGGGGATWDNCGSSNFAQCATCGGGGGATATKLGLTLLNGQRELLISIGAGGFGGFVSAGPSWSSATTGGATSVVHNGGAVLTASGGAAAGSNGGNGGGGGGGAVVQYDSENRIIHSPTAGPGGADGNDGSTQRSRYNSNVVALGGVGQHTTTRAFGEASGKLYGGGGGGAGAHTFNDRSDKSAVTASGGGGGGGSGAAWATTRGGDDSNLNLIGINGTDGLGGGGGASAGAVFSRAYQKVTGGNGGAGILIIRWNEV